MAPTRRSLAVGLIAAAASRPAAAQPAAGPAPAAPSALAAAGRPLPAPVPVAVPGAAGIGNEPRALLLRARAALPAAGRPRAALDNTLLRLDDFAPEASAPRLVLVNVAAAEAIAYQDGREVLRSRVVVGANRTRTPQLASYVTAVRCNPPWYVPASIEPEIRAAGAVGFRTVNGRLVQPPGPRNPLGPIRIGLGDSDGIFLHGTSSPELFNRGDRALSHGCVRVERVFELAAWILDTDPAALRATVAQGRTNDLVPARDVAVALAYLSAWPGAGGRVLIHADPYGLDQPGARRLAPRRVLRPAPQPPAEVAAEAAAAATAGDDPL